MAIIRYKNQLSMNYNSLFQANNAESDLQLFDPTGSNCSLMGWDITDAIIDYPYIIKIPLKTTQFIMFYTHVILHYNQYSLASEYIYEEDYAIIPIYQISQSWDSKYATISGDTLFVPIPIKSYTPPNLFSVDKGTFVYISLCCQGQSEYGSYYYYNFSKPIKFYFLTDLNTWNNLNQYHDSHYFYFKQPFEPLAVHPSTGYFTPEDYIEPAYVDIGGDASLRKYCVSFGQIYNDHEDAEYSKCLFEDAYIPSIGDVIQFKHKFFNYLPPYQITSNIIKQYSYFFNETWDSHNNYYYISEYWTFSDDSGSYWPRPDTLYLIKVHLIDSDRDDYLTVIGQFDTTSYPITDGTVLFSFNWGEDKDSLPDSLSEQNPLAIRLITAGSDDYTDFCCIKPFDRIYFYEYHDADEQSDVQEGS